MKYHSHNLRREVWTVISGSGRVVLDEKKRVVSVGDTVEIPENTKHMILADTDMTIVEVQIGESISGKDKSLFEYQ